MDSTRKFLFFIALGAIWSLLPACSKSDDPTAPATGSFDAVIDAGGTYKSLDPGQTTELVAEAEDVLPDGTVMLCTTERHSVVDTPLEYATFDPNAEVVFPGNLLQGRSLGGATPAPIVVERAGGTITINLVNGSDEVSASVGTVSYSEVIQAMNDIVADNNGVLPAAFTFRSAQVQSRHQMALAMGVNVESVTSNVSARLNMSSDETVNSFLVELNQRYYTMVFNMPTSTGALFAPEVTPHDLARYVAPDNPATYISSVTYGRRFYLLIESTESASAMQASIKASYDAALAGGSGYLQGRDFSTLTNVNVKVFALGGDQQLALAAFNGNVDAVAEFLTQGGGIDTGVPLSYVVRNVKDNSTVAINVATEYETTACVTLSTGSFVNDFTNGPEGWTGYADFRDFGTYTSGGIDGPYIKLYDRGAGQTCYFRAPLAYHGDWTRFSGGRMSYYMWIGGPGEYGAVDDVVIYDSARNRLALRLPAPSANGFFPYYIDLDTRDNWKFNGATATDEQIQLVLSDVVDLFIRAEYRNKAGDWAAMDRFRLTQPVEVP